MASGDERENSFVDAIVGVGAITPKSSD